MIRRIINRPPRGVEQSHPTDTTPPTYLQLGELVATYNLTMPPTLSQSTFNAPGRGRPHSKEANAWTEGNEMLLMAGNPYRKPLDFPVDVWIYLGLAPNQMVSDCANREKLVTDLMVRCGVLVNDSAKWVRGSHQVYHPGVEKGMVRVEVRRANE